MDIQLLLLLLLQLKVSIAQFQEFNPCDAYFKIVSGSQGELTFPLQVGSNQIDLRFSQKGLQDRANVGSLKPYPDEATVQANANNARFRLSLFPDAKGALPKLTRFAYNDMEVCTSTAYDPETYFNRFYVLPISQATPPRRLNSIPGIRTLTDSNPMIRTFTQEHSDVEIRTVTFDDPQASISHIISDILNSQASTSEPSWQEYLPVARTTTTTAAPWQNWQPPPKPQVSLNPPSLTTTTTTPWHNWQPPQKPRVSFNPPSLTTTTNAPASFLPIDPRMNRKLTPHALGCGQESLYIPFIQKGRDIPRGMYPWLAVVYHKESRSLIFKCGGSLVSATKVITAAHCVYQQKEDSVTVGLGRFDLDNHDEDGAERREVSHILNHPEYSTRPAVQPDADISLITLLRPVSFSDVISPICLWEAEESETSIEFGTVAGWGKDENGYPTRFPRSVTTKIANSVECGKTWRVPKVLARALCAGNLDGSGPCLGDSGGGLMIKRNDRWFLRGIVSLGERNAAGSCNNTQYVLYCDLAKHLTWIDQNIG